MESHQITGRDGFEIAPAPGLLHRPPPPTSFKPARYRSCLPRHGCRLLDPDAAASPGPLARVFCTAASNLFVRVGSSEGGAHFSDSYIKTRLPPPTHLRSSRLAPPFKSTPSFRPLIVMGCFPDFCLACDQQTACGPYCSQACRLTDLERGPAGSEPVSPLQRVVGPARWESSHSTPTSSSPVGFYLSSPVDFAVYRQSRHGQITSARDPHPARTAFHPAHPPPPPSSRTDLPRHPLLLSSRSEHASTRLTPSSSQTSLVSLRSNTSSTDERRLSDETWSELRHYASSFDVTRDHKRRLGRA